MAEAIDVCMMGARSADQVGEDLRALDLGPLGPDEMSRMRRIGDHIYGKPRARPPQQAEASR